MTTRKGRGSGIAKVPRKGPLEKRYRVQETQTRKVLGRHYAARYRIGKGR